MKTGSHVSFHKLQTEESLMHREFFCAKTRTLVFVWCAETLPLLIPTTSLICDLRLPLDGSTAMIMMHYGFTEKESACLPFPLLSASVNSSLNILTTVMTAVHVANAHPVICVQLLMPPKSQLLQPHWLQINIHPLCPSSVSPDPSSDTLNHRSCSFEQHPSPPANKLPSSLWQIKVRLSQSLSRVLGAAHFLTQSLLIYTGL